MNIRFVLAAAMILLAAVYLIRHRGSTGGRFYQVNQEYAKGIMEQEENVLVVDVRTPQEYAEGHIPGAILIPLDTIGDEPPKELPDLNQKILVYCRSGRRSKQAAGKLARLGYTEIYEIGGIMTWPYEIEK